MFKTALKELKKKYWVILASVGILLVFLVLLLTSKGSSNVFEDLDPEDYKDSPELHKLVVRLSKGEEPQLQIPAGVTVWGGIRPNYFQVHEDCYSDPRYFDLLVMGLNAEPLPKTPQFSKYLYNLCWMEKSYTWTSLINGKYYKDDNADIRIDACRALGKLDDKRAIPVFIKALNDDNRSVRVNACLGLGKFKDKRAYKPLVGMLKDPSHYVVTTSMRELYRLGGKERGELLVKLLKHSDDKVKSYACYKLGKLKDKIAIEPLVQSLENENYEVRSEAAGALTEFNDKRAVPVLIEVVRNTTEQPYIRSNACWNLVRLGDKRAVPLFRELLKDSEFKKTATKCLEKMGVEGD